MTNLSGQHALVTGGGRGIGRAIAELLTDAGARVTITGRDAVRLTAAAGEIGAKPLVLDQAEEAAVNAGFAAAEREAGPIDILVNNAGAAESAPFAKTDPALWSRMIAINLTATYLGCRAALPGMLMRGRGRIINVASTAGLVGYAYVTAYVAAKHGVIGLTRALALETARKGVTVNAVCPGYTETDLVLESIANIQAKTGKSAAEARAALSEKNPQGRLVQPREVADAVLWLASPSAAAITGQAIAVAGGEVMS